MVSLKYRGTSVLNDACTSNLVSLCLEGITTPKHKEFEIFQKELQNLYARIIGEVSTFSASTAISIWTDVTTKAIESGNINDACSLLDCMRYCSFSLRDDKGIHAVRDFISLILQYITKKTKSEIIASCYSLVGNILIKLADEPEEENVDYTGYREWVTSLYNDHKKSWKKLKDPLPALFMEAGILCNGKKSFFAQQPFSVFERLGKLTKYGDKNRYEVLDCLFFLIFTLLTKYSRVKDAVDTQLIVQKVLLEIIPSATNKKLVPPQSKCISVITDISSLISFFHLDYIVKHILLSPFPHTEYFERSFIALQTLYQITERLAIIFVLTKHSFDNIESVLFSNRRAIALRKLRETSKGSLSDETLKPIQQSLGELLLFIDQQIGSYLTFKTTDGLLSGVGGTSNNNLDSHSSKSSLKDVKDKTIYYDFLSLLIQCFFKVTPLGISSRKFFSLIVKYCFHVDKNIKSRSIQLLNDVMKTRPAFRGLLIDELVSFINSIPDTDISNLHSATQFLNELIVMWQDPTVIHQLDTDLDSFGMEDRNLPFPVFRVEALGLVLLCNRNSAIRSDAYNILENSKKLTDCQPSELSKSTTRIFSIIIKNESKILSLIKKDSTYLSISKKAIIHEEIFENIYQLLVSMRIDEQQLFICRCIGEICKIILNNNCRVILQTAVDFAWNKLNSIHLTSVSNKRQTTLSEANGGDSYIMWRNYLTLILSTGMGQKTTVDNIFQKIMPCVVSTNSSLRFSFKYALQYSCRGILNSFLTRLFSLSELDSGKKKDHIIAHYEVAEILRICSTFFEVSFLRKNPKIVGKYLNFLKDSFIFLQNNSQSISSSTYSGFYDIHPNVVILHFTYNLFRVSNLLLEQIRIINSDDLSTLQLEGPSNDLLEVMFNVINRRCGFGNFKNEQQIRDNKIIEIQQNQNNLSVSSSSLVDYFHDIKCTQYWSLLLLNEICYFDGKLFTSNQEIYCDMGPVFTIASDVFASVERDDKKKSNNLSLSKATIKLLSTFLCNQINHSDFLFQICIEKSFFDTNPYISQGYLTVIIEALESNPLKFEYRLTQLLLLGLFKFTDSLPNARNSSVRLLQWLSNRFFKNSKDVNSLFPLASTKIVYEKQFERITHSYSSHHPEIMGEMIGEIFGIVSRIKTLAATRQMLRLCSAWFVNISLSDVEDNISWIVQCLIVLTFQLGTDFDSYIEKLWYNIASTSNTVIIFETLISIYSKKQHPNLLLCINKIIVILFNCFPEAIVHLCTKILHPHQPFYNYDKNLDISKIRPYEHESIPNANKIFNFEAEWEFDYVFSNSFNLNNNNSTNTNANNTNALVNTLSCSTNAMNNSINSNNTTNEHDFNKTSSSNLISTDSKKIIPPENFILFVLPDLLILNVKPFLNIIPVLLQCVITQIDHPNTKIRSINKELLFIIVSSCMSLLTDNSQAMKKFQNFDKQLTSGQEFLWYNEDMNSIFNSDQIIKLVKMILHCLVLCKKTLREDWSNLAIFWAINLSDIKGNHIVSRSLQIFRALESPLNTQILNSLGDLLIRSIKNRVGTDIQISVEIMETLSKNVIYTSRKTLRKLPHLFWFAVAMLNSSIPEEFVSAVKLLSSLIDEMQIQSDTVYNALLTTEPQEWKPIPYHGLYLILLKGMCSRKTDSVTRSLFIRLAMSPCSLLLHNSDEHLRYLIPTIALLPSLIFTMGGDDSIEISEKLAGAYILWNKPKMVHLMTEYPVYCTSEEGIRRFIYEVTELIAKLFFPKYELFVFTFLVELRNNGSPIYEKIITQLISALVAFVDFSNSKLNSNLPLLGLATPQLECKYSEESFVFLESIFSSSIKANQQNSFHLDVQKFQSAIDSTQNISHTWHRLPSKKSHHPLIIALTEALNPEEKKFEAFKIANEIDIRDQVKSIKLGKNDVPTELQILSPRTKKNYTLDDKEKPAPCVDVKDPPRANSPSQPSNFRKRINPAANTIRAGFSMGSSRNQQETGAPNNSPTRRQGNSNPNQNSPSSNTSNNAASKRPPLKRGGNPRGRANFTSLRRFTDTDDAPNADQLKIGNSRPIRRGSNPMPPQRSPHGTAPGVRQPPGKPVRPPPERPS